MSTARGPAASPPPAVERKKSTKIVVRRKKKIPSKRSLGIPSSSTIASSSSSSISITATTLQRGQSEEFDEFPLDESLLSETLLPCDTLLLIRSIVEKQRCLYVPLMASSAGSGTMTMTTMMVPTVLQSQLYDIMQKDMSPDTIVTRELQELKSQNRLRRLVSSVEDDESMIAWMETKHYVRAVWDAYRHYSSQPKQTIGAKNDEEALAIKATTWFVSNLKHWTKRTISKEALEQEWNKSNHNKTFFHPAIDLLVNMQILLPCVSGAAFLTWLPAWGSVLSAIDKAQKSIIRLIHMSQYKELSLRTIEKNHYAGGLSGSFVLHTLLAQHHHHRVQVVDRPSGKFVRLQKG